HELRHDAARATAAADPQLAAPAGGLSRPLQLAGRYRHRRSPAAWPNDARGGDATELRALAGAGFRAGDGLLRRTGQRARGADSDRRDAATHFRLRARERLERARYSKMGVRAAGAVL